MLDSDACFLLSSDANVLVDMLSSKIIDVQNTAACQVNNSDRTKALISTIEKCYLKWNGIALMHSHST